MRKTILVLTASALVLGAILTGCSSPADKVENAQERVDDANEKLDQANENYLIEIEKYKEEAAYKIAANEKSIADFNARIENEKLAAKTDYEMKIANLEQKNTDLKKSLDEYRATNRENWEAFKAEFNKDMDQLGQSFKDLIIKND